MDDEVWSDTENDYKKYLYETHMSDEFDFRHELQEHKRSFFKGDITTDTKIKYFDSEFNRYKTTNDTNSIPCFPSRLSSLIDTFLLETLWSTFLQFSSKNSDMIKIQNIPSMMKNTENIVGYSLYSECLVFKRFEDGDYVDFQTIVQELSKILISKQKSNHNLIDLRNKVESFPCCAFESCKHFNKQINSIDLKIINNNNNKNEEVEINKIKIVYNTFKHKLNGKIKLNNIPDMFLQLDINYNKKKLKEKYLTIKEDFLIHSINDFIDIINELTNIENNFIENINFDTKKLKYKNTIPDWLKNEFNKVEIDLYELKFFYLDKKSKEVISMLDLYNFFVSFGSSITLAEVRIMNKNFLFFINILL
jgi:hypothetical protein